MQYFTIHIDGLAYQGEAVEEYDTNHGGGGWHAGNHAALNDIIIAAGTPKRIGGPTNLRSELDRIVKRMRDKRIKPRQIVITVESDE